MRFYKEISIAVAVMLTLLGVVACSNDTDTVLTSQQNSISKYLTTSHRPRLVAEEEIGTSMDDEPQFYTHWGLDIYRYIATYYDEGRQERPVIERGSQIEITYTAYLFTGGTPTAENMFATNDANSIAELEAQGLNTTYEWTTEPYVVRIGKGDILESIETALIGCHEQDQIEVYLTYNSAYGKDYIGKIPSKSSLVWFIHINSVTK